MSDDLTKRLRADVEWLTKYPPYGVTNIVNNLVEAADRIDELEAELDGMTIERDDWIVDHKRVQALVNDIAENEMFTVDREATDEDWETDDE